MTVGNVETDFVATIVLSDSVEVSSSIVVDMLNAVTVPVMLATKVSTSS